MLHTNPLSDGSRSLLKWVTDAWFCVVLLTVPVDLSVGMFVMSCYSTTTHRVDSHFSV